MLLKSLYWTSMCDSALLPRTWQIEPPSIYVAFILSLSPRHDLSPCSLLVKYPGPTSACACFLVFAFIIIKALYFFLILIAYVCLSQPSLLLWSCCPYLSYNLRWESLSLTHSSHLNSFCSQTFGCHFWTFWSPIVYLAMKCLSEFFALPLFFLWHPVLISVPDLITFTC